MAEFDDFLPDVLPHAPACPAPVAEKALRDAATEFCERTRCWRLVETIPVEMSDVDIAVTPLNAILHEIEDVWFDGARLDAVSFDEFEPGDDTDGLPKSYFQVAPGSIRILPRAAGSLKVAMFLKPARASVDLPDFLLDQHCERIAYGALSRILVLPDLPFSNPQRAVYFAGLWREALDRKFDLNRRGQQRAPTRTTPRFM